MKLRSLLVAAAFAIGGCGMAFAAVTQFDFDDTFWHRYYTEFDRYAAADWTLTTTEAGAGDATEALTNVDGGALLITNDAADDDRDFFQLPVESFKWESTKRLYFKARFKVSDATQSDIVMGLQITDTTPLAVSDGIFFQKDDGDAFLDLHVEKNGTETLTAAVATLANDTYVTVAFYYDPGHGTVQYYVNDALAGESVITNIVDDEELTVSFGLQNGEAVAKTMTVDYIFASKQR